MVNIKSFCAICVVCASTKHYVKGVSRTNFGFVYHTITAKNDLEIPKSSLYHSYRDISIYKNSQNTSNCLHSQRNFSTVQHQTIRDITMDSKSLVDLLKANKASCENLLKRRFFYANSFDIYGGAAGLYDYGPPGCALKVELENLWRQHFVIFDEMLEVSCPCITPYAVLKASGHIDRFTDLMVTDVVNGECYRADKYLEDVIDSVISTLKGKTVADNVNAKNTALLNLGCDELEKIRNLLGNMSLDDVENFIRENNITSPIGNELSKPYPFNLMFETTIGPKSRQKGGINSVVYLRPETAQGIFVNFAKLLESNGGKMPLAAAQIGLGFRNEISPRNGLLRVREFLMAEVEYFVHPKNKTHARYDEFKHIILSLLPKDVQEKGESNLIRISVEDAVNRGIIANEALGYFLARTSLFLEKCGIFNEGLRFRQHMSDEMAHYACDCWDAEILTSYGWIEVVGHADRMAYDLQAHSKATNIQLNASQRYPEPITVDKVVPNYNRSLIGKTFKDKHVMLLEILNNMAHPEAMKLEEELSATGMTTIKAADGHVFEVTREMLSFKSVKAVVCEETFTPAVIEPSFGIGRLIFCILEHSYRVRPAQDQQEERTYIAIKPMLAPIKCCLLPLSSKDVFQPMISKIQNNLDGVGLSYKIDCTGASIGKRYARMDEIGIPYAITVDFQSLNDGTVTVRERDSMQQVRIDVEMVCCLISDLLRARTTWEDVVKKHSLFIQQEV
ncbi:putative glycyl-tRNA synthetase [Babesia bovis T2Bo]|uniref:glycine--tRNA ligase n=1 Tax=Babesia bovis TaxID=5865 RepID=A7AWN1_BABBO|nr:putative glycyl-tRNA synthetase [Babesia bovis T2Bo]EDO05459.1 putative glycyl-tRNA synthetase [Babesia bovis T2Bo]|eukprot:XP_001609027.1 glycyl-tRNA synthetase [Babesia bovis T2Bo]